VAKALQGYDQQQKKPSTNSFSFHQRNRAQQELAVILQKETGKNN